MDESVAQFAPPGVEGAPASDDWQTIWQSELAALAVDREWQDGLQLAAAGWAALARDASGRAGADAAARAAPADATFDARDAELARLRARIAELERAAGGA